MTTSKNPWTLFEISQEIEQIISELIDAENEKDTALIETLTEELIETLDKHEQKYESYIFVIKNATAAAEANQKVAAEFQAKARAQKRLAKNLKDRLHGDMILHGTERADAGMFSIRRQKNSAPSVEINVPVDHLPTRFWKVEPDTEHIRYALKNGEVIEGVELTIGEHIRITLKK